ncbi:MAG: MFS transporter [Alphaproteobacteria bacterium]|mgnify:CR=1 FL=1|jgi:MFS family permease|nr:MFS transporter [Rhodospirillaceae bacterium]MBT6205629.1 MFS transporter [Rhodospirillaceae bacterium]MBT7612958.1 MFS transporter [Rhodospirillaceae bacterium]MBT7647210.1 MFS transporter [Rhodospirillaceae bacterium]MDG2479732.1 MFS transporter [Alphaproteobacteria bacterium]
MVIAAGCAIAMIGFGVRSVFGLFLEPITEARGWSRETFSIALAIQNLLWGLGMPIAGMIADRFGPARVIVGGAIVYALGTWAMSVVDSGSLFYFTAGIMVGIGIAFTAFSLALASMARVVPKEKRSLILGLGTAAGSFGQVVFSPNAQLAIDHLGWQGALLALAAAALALIPLAFLLPRATTGVDEVVSDQSMSDALTEARGHLGFVLLTFGFFVCGFQIAFITVHFPAYVTGLGLSSSVAAWAIAIVGGCNILGSLAAGAFGQRWSKRYGPAMIYLLRSVIIVCLLMAPKMEMTIYIFAASMGFLWLATVPLTSGIVAQVFGTRYMATLFGIVFFSHQTGSFIGVWLGGWLYDNTGSHDIIWWISAALGLAAAAVHLPIDERPLARLQPSTG